MALHSVVHSPKFSILPEGKTETRPQPATIPISDVLELCEEIASDARMGLQRAVIEGKWNHAHGSLAVITAMAELESRMAGGE